MPMMSPGKASSASSRLCAKKKIGLGTAIGLPVCTWVSFMPRLNLPEHSRMKATRSRCCGFMFACTLTMNPETAGSPGSTTRGSSEEHPSELQALMRISYDVFCLYKHHLTYLYTYHHRPPLIYRH